MDEQIRKRALRLISNGLYVLTSRDGERVGAATVSWVSQVSFKPPLVMAALRPDCNAYLCLRASGIAALHVLADSQKDLARRFFFTTRAGAGTINDEPFADGSTSAPILANLSAYVECRLEQHVDTGGDHAIVVLRVVDGACPEAVKPLTVAQTPWSYGG